MTFSAPRARKRSRPRRWIPSGWLLVLACFQELVSGSLHAQADPVAPNDERPATPATPVVTISKQANPSPVDAAPSAQGGGVGGLGAANGDYVLRSGDTIDLVVYREQDLNMRSKIGKDGMVQLPLLGEVKLGGLTVRSASALVRQKYNADYLVEPQIYLNVSNYNTLKFTIIGQVGRPGTYEYSGSEPLGLLEGIGMAGGFTRIADRGHVVLKRREGGAVRTMKINAKKLADSGTGSFEIQSGDVINVGESWY